VKWTSNLQCISNAFRQAVEQAVGTQLRRFHLQTWVLRVASRVLCAGSRGPWQQGPIPVACAIDPNLFPHGYSRSADQIYPTLRNRGSSPAITITAYWSNMEHNVQVTHPPLQANTEKPSLAEQLHMQTAQPNDSWCAACVVTERKAYLSPQKPDNARHRK
jgi:hypothetical protein